MCLPILNPVPSLLLKGNSDMIESMETQVVESSETHVELDSHVCTCGWTGDYGA